MKCAACGQVLGAGAVKCPQCGALVVRGGSDELVGKSELDVEKQLVSLIEKGNQLERQGKYAEAIEVLRKAMEVAEYKGGLQKRIEKLEKRLKEEMSSTPASSSGPLPPPPEDLDKELEALAIEMQTPKTPLPTPTNFPSPPPPAPSAISSSPPPPSSSVDAPMAMADEGEGQGGEAFSPSKKSVELVQNAMFDAIFGGEEEECTAPTAESTVSPPTAASRQGAEPSPLQVPLQETLGTQNSVVSGDSPVLAHEEEEDSTSFLSVFVSALYVALCFCLALVCAVGLWLLWQVYEVHRVYQSARELLVKGQASQAVQKLKRVEKFPVLRLFHMPKLKKLKKDLVFEEEVGKSRQLLERLPLPSLEEWREQVQKLKQLAQTEEQKQKVDQLVSLGEKLFLEQRLSEEQDLLKRLELSYQLYRLSGQDKVWKEVYATWLEKLERAYLEGKIEEAEKGIQKARSFLPAQVWQEVTQKIDEWKIVRELQQLAVRKDWGQLSKMLERALKKHFASPKLHEFIWKFKPLWRRELEKAQREGREKEKKALRKLLRLLGG